MPASQNVIVESLRAVIFFSMLGMVGYVIHRAARGFLGSSYLGLGPGRWKYAARHVALALVLGLGLRLFEWFVGTSDKLLIRIMPVFPPGYFAVLLTGIYQTIIALLALFVVLQLVGEIYWWAETRLAVLREQESINERQQLIRGSFVWDGLSLLNRGFRGTALAILVLLFPWVFFSFFPRTRVWLDLLQAAVGQPLTDVLKAIADYLPNMATLLVIGAMGALFLRLMHYIFSSIGRGTLVIGTFPTEWAEPTHRLVRTLFLLFLLMVSYPYLPGASSQFFQGFSVFVGALVTFGSSGAIGNVVAGTLLTYTRSFRVGDMVRIGSNTGRIVEKSLLVTRMLTPLNEEVTIPNGAVLSNEVKNYSAKAQEGGLVLTVAAGIGYDVDWRTVHSLLIGAALRTPGIQAEPAPEVVQLELGDFAVNYQLRARTLDALNMVPVTSRLRANVLDAFNAAGVEIMTPAVQAIRDASGMAIPAEHTAPAPLKDHALRITVEGRAAGGYCQPPPSER